MWDEVAWEVGNRTEIEGMVAPKELVKGEGRTVRDAPELEPDVRQRRQLSGPVEVGPMLVEVLSEEGCSSLRFSKIRPCAGEMLLC